MAYVCLADYHDNCTQCLVSEALGMAVRLPSHPLPTSLLRVANMLFRKSEVAPHQKIWMIMSFLGDVLK